MSEFSRRAFLGASAGALALLHSPQAALAQATCVTGGLPPFLPSRVTVDCASRANFHLFRKNQDYMGLAGVVSMTTVGGPSSSYEAGSLMLFPWLKPKGQAFGAAKAWGAVYPVGTKLVPASPIPNWTLPIDDYFCDRILQVPPRMFIGFSVDVPYGVAEAKFAWFTNVDKLSDGSGVGIDWTSSNLNRAWFGGSQWIPATDTCKGREWRKLIIEGINQASVARCSTTVRG
jgi:hypothetical protein